MAEYTSTEVFTNLSALPNTDTSSGPRTFMHFKQQMHEMYRKHSLIRFVLKDTLAQLLVLFGSLSYINKEGETVGVKAVPAVQERAIAKILEDKNLILPMISVGQAGSDNDDNRRRTDTIIVPGKMWDDKKQRAIRTVSFPPRPVNLTYEVTIWDMYLNNIHQLEEQIFLLYNPYVEVPTRYSLRTKSYIESDENVSTVEVPDRENRVLKKMFTIMVETYIPSPVFKVTETGKIEVINTEFEIN